VQVEVVDESLQSIASRRAAPCGPAGETEICEPRSLSSKQGDVIAAGEMLAGRQQVLEKRVLDGVAGIAEDVPRDAGGIERIAHFHTELAQYFRQVPDHADAGRALWWQAVPSRRGRSAVRRLYG
jgi:hypothetical protein